MVLMSYWIYHIFLTPFLFKNLVLPFSLCLRRGHFPSKTSLKKSYKHRRLSNFAFYSEIKHMNSSVSEQRRQEARMDLFLNHIHIFVLENR